MHFASEIWRGRAKERQATAITDKELKMAVSLVESMSVIWSRNIATNIQRDDGDHRTKREHKDREETGAGGESRQRC